MCQHNDSTSMIVLEYCETDKHIGFSITRTLPGGVWCHNELKTVQNVDRIMIWIFPCQSPWPASLWFTITTAECGSTAMSLMCHESLAFLSGRKTANFFPSQTRLNFLPRCWVPSKSSQIDASPPSQISKKKTALYNVNFSLQLICISIEVRAEKLLFLICQSVRCAHHWQWQF